MKKRILIINTGGTISSVKTNRGYEPSAGYAKQVLDQNPTMQHKDMPLYDIKEYDHLLDSSNLTADDWNRIAQDIYEAYDNYQGFVVFHGTDTMAYTASALSFMLEGLGKPVILTGSQIPLSEVRNDALDNTINSLLLAANESLYEVCIYFGQTLLRGNRAQKIGAQQLRAFDSPNYAPLATVNTGVVLHSHLLLAKPNIPFTLQRIMPHFIANFRLFPGFSSDVLTYILQQPIKGLVLETYGAGNAPNIDPMFLASLEEACRKGVVIVNCTQCNQGRVEMNQYATGHSLKEIGLVSGQDMTPEAAHCKLLYLLSKNLDSSQVKALMEENLRGELSLNT